MLGSQKQNHTKEKGLCVTSVALAFCKFNISEKLMAKKREKRANQQSKECNLAMILMCTVAMFFFSHFPRSV